MILGAGVGLLVGLWEARLIYFVPSVQEFLVVDATYVIWFLAPLLDMIVFGIIGAVLGLIAGTGKSSSALRGVILTAVLIGCAGAYIGWAGHFIHTHSVNFDVYSRVKDVLYPAVRFAIVFAVALLIGLLVRKRLYRVFEPENRWPVRALGRAMAVILVVLVAGLVFYAEVPASDGAPVSAKADQAGQRPNIFLITMDTVRADHLTPYGYDRNTTPNLARFADKGVLFENAISAAPWTLPSLSSLYTGLLPHQSGGNAFRPLNPGWATIESVLGKHGYVTAGFNANYYYGESGWGLGSGFGMYDDDRTTIPYNLSRTLLGRVAVQPIYQNVDRYDAFYRRNAGDLNSAIFRWLRHKPSGPFYAYINYFDAHSPYLTSPPFNHRFGTLPESVVRRWSSKGGFHPKKPLPASARADLINGYDNCLAYLDSQIGDLVHFVESSPAGKNTIFIITADHGESFGEHGVYQHGNDVHREEIHVPLIVYGAGIPAGKRIAPPVPIRRLFATVLDLALGNVVPMHQHSLARFWEQDSPQDLAEPVVSELSSSDSLGGLGEISLTTAHWHYILTTKGRQYLYNWETDIGENHNLSSLPKYQPTVKKLNTDLRQLEANSAEPWIGTEYLFALGAGGTSSGSDKASSNGLKTPIEEIGAAQAYFHPIITMQGNGPSQSQKDLLKTLPYQ